LLQGDKFNSKKAYFKLIIQLYCINFAKSISIPYLRFLVLYRRLNKFYHLYKRNMAWQLETKTGLFLYISNLAVTILSLCGSLWTCYFCIKAGSGKNTSLKFIVAITCADLLYSLTNLMSAFESPSWEYLCYFEGLVREFSLQLTLFFSSCLAILCYKVTKFGTEFDQEKFFRNSLILAAIASTCSNSA